MKTTTELLDTMNRAERGDYMTVRTDAGEYEGELQDSHYAAPESEKEGVVGVDIRIEGGEFDGELLEVRSTAESSTQKFSRPVVRFPERDEAEREVLNLVLSEQ